MNPLQARLNSSLNLLIKQMVGTTSITRDDFVACQTTDPSEQNALLKYCKVEYPTVHTSSFITTEDEVEELIKAFHIPISYRL